MSLVETFPDDPWTPSLQYAASSLIPFSLPWSTQLIKIGTGFYSKKSHSGNPFADESAFDEQSLKTARLRYRSDGSGTFTHAQSSFASHSLEHMDFSLGASARVAIVEVSGQAKFEQNALKNSDGIKCCLAGKMFAGYVSFGEAPNFSYAAKELLRTARYAQAGDDFEKKYGDYYVAALRIGAANGTELSASSLSETSSEASSYSITATVEVFCWSVSTTYSDSSYKASATDSSSIKFNGYDTLSLSQSDMEASNPSAHRQLIVTANTNLEKGKLMQGRLQEATARFGLEDGCYVSQDQVDTLLGSGLVIEIQLLPYAKLREYISSCSRI